MLPMDIRPPQNTEHFNHVPWIIGLAQHARESARAMNLVDIAKQLIIAGSGGLVVLYAGVEGIKIELRAIREQMEQDRKVNVSRFDHLDKSIATNKTELIDVDKQLATRILECEKKHK